MDEMEAYEEIDRLRILMSKAFLWMAVKGVLGDFKKDSGTASDEAHKYMAQESNGE